MCVYTIATNLNLNQITHLPSIQYILLSLLLNPYNNIQLDPANCDLGRDYHSHFANTKAKFQAGFLLYHMSRVMALAVCTRLI